jgi:catechol 2,3-dioxygenase-like lactoylglutathione lyase family enzyme
VLGSAPLVAFVPSADLDRSESFYGGVLGLNLVESSGFANVYDANGTMLRVTRVDGPVAAPYTVLGWTVPDIAAAARELASKGIWLKRFQGMEQDDAGIWTAPGGSRIAWFEDPDGNILSLQQPPR